jgi:hypothetical protein
MDVNAGRYLGTTCRTRLCRPTHSSF